MDDNSGGPSNFIQRYLTQQTYPPGSYANTHSVNVSMQDARDNSYTHSRTPECQKLMNRISTFACEENLVQRVAFLDQELSVYGYPPVASDLTDGHGALSPPSGDLDLVTLVNILYDILQCWRQAIEGQGESNNLQRTTESEVVRLRHLNSRLKEDLANKDRDMKSKELTELQMTQRLESFKKKLKLEQEKSKRLSGEMTARDSQFKHEKKKKVQESEKLQARLQQLLQDKRQERMLGIEILNSLQRADGKRGKWSTDKTKKSNEHDMYRLIITNYEDAQKQLLKENEGMRKYLKEMQNELVSALNERNTHELSHPSMEEKPEGQDEGERQPSSRSSSRASNRSEPSDVSEHMSDGMFEMPYDLVKEDIERSIRTKWKALKKEITKSRKTDKTQQSNSKENFGDPEYDDLVQQQQELIDYLTTGEGESSDRPIPEDCYFLEEKAELEKQKNSFQQQQQTLEKERKVYAEALVQLDEQRRGFEAEKNKWFQQNFLQLTPFRNEGRPSTSPHQSVRGKESSIHKGRQQPALKNSGNLSSNHPSPDNTQSMTDVNHSLSRLNSSGQDISSTYITQNRGSEPVCSKRTPDNLSRGPPPILKTTPTTNSSTGPPTTAELYRTLGLVYYGSDKENEKTEKNGNEPKLRRSRETDEDHLMSPFQTSSNQDQISSPRFGGQLPRSNPDEHHSIPNRQGQHSKSNFEGQMPMSVFESQLPFRDTKGRSPRANFGSHTMSNFRSDSPSLDGQSLISMTDMKLSGALFQDQLPRSIPEVFKGKPKAPPYQHPRSASPDYLEYLSATASLDSEDKSTSSDYYDAQKSFRDRLPKRGRDLTPREDGEEQVRKTANKWVENVPHAPQNGSRYAYAAPERGKLYVSKSMDDKTLNYGIQGAERDANNMLKNSGIRSFVKTMLLGSPNPERRNENNNDKASSKILSTSDSLLTLRYYLDKDMESGFPGGLQPSAGPKTGQTPHSPYFRGYRQRTRSFPGSRMFGKDVLKPRSYSYDAPVLSPSAERHKSALISMSANIKPKDANSTKYKQDFESPERKRFILECKNGLFACLPTTNHNQSDFQQFKFDENQFDPEIYEEWSHSSLGSSTVPDYKPPPASQIHLKPVGTVFSQLKPAQVVGQPSDFRDVLVTFESSSSSLSKPISTVPSGHSLLEQIVAEQSFNSTTDEDQPNTLIQNNV